MRKFACVSALALVVACSPAPSSTAIATSNETATATATATAASAAGLPAGEYKLDKFHGSLLFRVNHMGFSHYTARFETWDATLQLDPAHPESASVAATVDVRSLDLESPPPGFQRQLIGPDWLDAAAHPQMTFRSTRVERTGADSANVTGDLTLRGQTHPVTLAVTFNGGYPGMSLDPHARIGFSAHGALKRSDFGLTAGIPAPGTNMGVSDDVEIIIEAEFSGPPLAPAAGK